MVVHLLAAVPLNGNVGHPLGLRNLLVLADPRPSPPLLRSLRPQTGLPGIRLQPSKATHIHTGGVAASSTSATTTAADWIERVLGHKEVGGGSSSGSGRAGGARGFKAAERGSRDGVMDDEVQELIRR